MKQQEIQFFWPLTEQVPLDLDYSLCSPYQYYIKAQGQPAEGPFTTGMVFCDYPTTISPVVTIQAEHLTIKTPSMPWYRKLAYKLMGFKWE
jgi:hypothetical protein